MFETFQTIINAGGYDLADLTQRIKTMYAMSELTEEEMKQLLEQAQTNAKPDDSYGRPFNKFGLTFHLLELAIRHIPVINDQSFAQGKHHCHNMFSHWLGISSFVASNRKSFGKIFESNMIISC